MGHMSPSLKARRGRFGPGGFAPTLTVSAFSAGVTVTVPDSGFTASASDQVDGDITSSITWVSDLDGSVGTGGSPTITLTTVGTHTITVTATAPTGAQTVTTTISVEAAAV